ncbi:TIGR03905 family TSCPD domain-containing protein [Selenomonas montiformis]|uniref:TIGR03905 family TSCPD domain-containing protein n=1 Tax=Selenomonas montiformis TaxID=2652285 RepID=UPI003F89AAE4
MYEYEYRTKGTCSRRITVRLNGKTIEQVAFEGGCNGNLSGIAKLVRGMDIDFVISRFRGNRCGNRPTSCPDQLAVALREAYEAEQREGKSHDL